MSASDPSSADPSSRAVVGTRGRYAPSPTGELHLGNARTALVAWLAARAGGGSFVVRVEDLDPPRVVRGSEGRILRDLEWLGLDWDEGPDVGGSFAPYRQSERGSLYRAELERLRRAGRLYACTCTRAHLRSLLSAPHGPGSEGPPYPGTCRDKNIPIDLDRGPALRLKLTKGEMICFDDDVFGRTCQDVSASVGDFVLRRSDGLFTYQLAVTVDDAVMRINQVVRGADLIESTPRQIALQRLLGYPTPGYAHVPLVLNERGERLAKRDRRATIADLREAGASAEKVVGRLARSLGIVASEDPVRAAELIGVFDPKALRTEPWRVPIDDES